MYRWFVWLGASGCVTIPVSLDKYDSGLLLEEEVQQGPPIEEACHEAIEGWSDSWSDYEKEVLVLLNARRAEGADCQTEGQFAPAGPLTMSPYLTCSSRFHSYWMGIIQNELMHESPGGDLGNDPWQRIASTGFPGSATGENIAAGYSTPEDVVAGWMSSDGHCANIMTPGSNVVGVGYFVAPQSGYVHWWTTNFGYE